MISKFITYLTISEAMMLLLLLGSSGYEAKESIQQNDNQPLSGLERVLRQASGMKLDSLMDPKVTSDMTSTLNDMAMNLRKMFMENRRLATQIQDIAQRVQNTTGVNATSAMNTIQRQASNMTSLNNLNVNGLISRFQNQ